jgi:hypothetical protein
MLERDLLLNGTAAILLACLAWLHATLARRLGRPGLVLVVAGALLPLATLLVSQLTTQDRIAQLSRAPLYEAPLVTLGALAVVAVLVGFATAPGVAARLGLGLALGYALYVLLAVLTPLGWPLLAPFSPLRVALPILPAGHLPLLVLGFAALALGEGLPRLRRWAAPVAAALAAVYLLAGAVQFAVVSARTRGLATADTTVSVAPDGDWLTHWQVVSEGPERYELRRVVAFAAAWPEPRTLPRWNDEPLFLKLLGDPVVNGFYFRVFHHPVVRLDVSGAQITLLMQELEDQSPTVPGPTFYLESDLSGRNRFYQLQRFN